MAASNKSPEDAAVVSLFSNNILQHIVMEMPLAVTTLPQNLQKYLDNVIKKEGYVTYKVDTRPVDARGTGFLSSSYAVTIKGETSDGEKETQVFIKGILAAGILDNIINMPQAFAYEAFVYNELSQVFAELQDDAGIPKEERFRLIRSFGVSSSEGIFLENVVVQGYKPFDRKYLMSLEVAEAILDQIAKFHALSFVIKAKRPNYYEKKIKTVKYSGYFEDPWRKFFERVAMMGMRCVTEAARERLEKVLPQFFTKWTEHNLDSSSAGSCLRHGDLRLGNLLVKHTNGKFEDLYLVDYQMINFGCPVLDLLCILIPGTDQQFRRKHLSHLVNFYYSRFQCFLKKFNLESEEFYPRKAFHKDYKERFDFGLIVAVYFSPLFWADPYEIPDFKEGDPSKLDFKVMDGFPEYFQGIVDDYMEWGYL